VGHGLFGDYHSVRHRQPMGIHRNWIFLCARSVQESRGASIRNEPFFFDSVSQTYSDSSWGDFGRLSNRNCAYLEILQKSSSADHVSRQDCVDILRARYHQANDNPL
jgi:hypothetical protein